MVVTLTAADITHELCRIWECFITLSQRINISFLAEKSSSLPGSSRELVDIFGTSDDEENIDFPFSLNVGKSFPELLPEGREAEFFLNSLTSLSMDTSLSPAVEVGAEKAASAGEKDHSLNNKEDKSMAETKGTADTKAEEVKKSDEVKVEGKREPDSGVNSNVSTRILLYCICVNDVYCVQSYCIVFAMYVCVHDVYVNVCVNDVYVCVRVTMYITMCVFLVCGVMYD